VCQDNICMKSIEPGTVEQAIGEMLLLRSQAQ